VTTGPILPAGERIAGELSSLPVAWRKVNALAGPYVVGGFVSGHRFSDAING
jgi:hypothetical protein